MRYKTLWPYLSPFELKRRSCHALFRPDVDANRIGSTGISLGGMHTWFLGLADSRVRVLAPAIGVQVSDLSVRAMKLLWHAA